jgi:hypothetical protein
VRSTVQDAMLEALSRILKPVVRLALRCGVGYTEVSAILKSSFIAVAEEDYGVRGRAANTSRISTLTGLSRKQVRALRMSEPNSNWTPDLEGAPVNTVLHYWHHDPEFSVGEGTPRPLAVEGSKGFSGLVKKYVGDIPESSIRKELQRAGAVEVDDQGVLYARKRYCCPDELHEDFVRYLGFAISNISKTLVFNATLSMASEENAGNDVYQRRFERCAWTARLSPDAVQKFREWVAIEAARFIETADHWIGQHELARSDWPNHDERVIGVGLYYFQDD